MTKDRWVECRITFFYNQESYLYDEEDEDDPSEDEILDRCKEMMIADLQDGGADALDKGVIYASFSEPEWASDYI